MLPNPFETSTAVMLSGFDFPFFMQSHIFSGPVWIFRVLFFFFLLSVDEIKSSTLLRLFVLCYNIFIDLSVSYIGYLYTYLNSFYAYIFCIIYYNNVISLLPYTYAVTGQLGCTMILAVITIIYIYFLGIDRYRSIFYDRFIIVGIPSILVYVLLWIEFASFIFRFVSLSLRLFANIVAGHLLLHAITDFLLTFNILLGFGLFDSWMLCVISGLLCILIFVEFIIAGLQAYIFIILSLYYTQEVLIYASE